MDAVNKTMYIPLYGKAMVSKKGVILRDETAEEIWAAEGFPLKGKSRSRWLAYYMAMRAAVFDEWLKEKLLQNEGAAVLHLGCGLDSRVCRVGTQGHQWYDVDFPAVIEARKRCYRPSAEYRMVEADVRERSWLREIPKGGSALVLMEGVSMYLAPEELKTLLTDLRQHFGEVSILADCYTGLGAKLSKVKNPINDVGVTAVWGLDDPAALAGETGLRFVSEHALTPDHLIDELPGMERAVFRQLFGGTFAKKMYRLYEYAGA